MFFIKNIITDKVNLVLGSFTYLLKEKYDTKFNNICQIVLKQDGT